MKERFKRFKSLAIALKELQPFMVAGQQIQTGKPFKNFGEMRPREALGNWLICVVSNFEAAADRFFFTTDPSGGDGVIHDATTSVGWRMEHVLVPRQNERQTSATDSIEDRVLAAIEAKRNKGGQAYASGKQLVVFVNSGTGQWFPNRVARRLPKPLLFSSVWIVALQTAEPRYVYAVTKLDVSEGIAYAWLVFIAPGFDTWSIERYQ